MGKMSIKKVKENLDEIVHQVQEYTDRVIITIKGKPAAAIVPIEDYEFLEEVDDEVDKKMIEEIKARGTAENEETIPFEEVKRRLGMK